MSKTAFLFVGINKLSFNRNKRKNRNNRIIVDSERNNKPRLIVSESRHDVNEVNKRFQEIRKSPPLLVHR